MNTQQLKKLAQLATPWPWKWFTSNSHNRLSSVPSGKDGDVISAFKAVDGVACVSVSRADMAFIEAAHPGAVIELITSNEILSHEFEETKQLLRSTREKLTRAIDRNVAKDIEIKRLSAVERERDELRAEVDRLDKESQRLTDQLGACDRERRDWIKRAQEAEAELARRDAAAREPVAVVDIQRGRGDGKKFALCYTSAGHSLPDDVYNLYTAAPPAVLPPEMKGTHDPFVEGYNQCRADAIALGAQPQKPVVLPALFNLKMAGDVKTKQYFKGSNDTIKQIAGLLDAANVPYEVKK
ncbi:hypothetical protein [Erwinia sp. JH02]|uniref:hypothetical protein n=1 Tax=Erwinia sp. JH02 TaxID=2733394 RepID=UPI0014896A20|nr:hypothetical protein [Erwinia sp. JH02]NNS07284.1 hypothetical protein [Erwinia sp. JH02]